MKWLAYTLIILLVIILEQGLFRVIGLSSFTPDLLLLLTLASVWSSTEYDFFIFALVGGFWLELTLGLPIGSLSLGLMIIGGVSYFILHHWIYSEKSWQYFLGAVVLGTIFYHLWIWLYSQILFFFHWSSLAISFGSTWRAVLAASLSNLILIYPIYALLEWVAKILQNLSQNKIKL